jgi:hypothetical protein
MTAPDLTTYHAIHAALRHGAHLLAAGVADLDTADARRRKAYRAYWQGYSGEVLAHHTVEDDFFFPALAERVPATREYMARLAADHADLDELMAESTLAIDRICTGDAASSVAVEYLRNLASHMDGHLDFEDEEILPLFERHFSAEEYAALDDKAVKSLGIGKQAAFTVPFVAASVTPDVRDEIIAGAPVPFRVLYRLTRGRHARLTTTAFGAVALAKVA